MALAAKVNVPPTQTGLLEDATGVEGTALMATFVVATALLQLPTMAVTL
jgi:hypothetical protein